MDDSDDLNCDDEIGGDSDRRRQRFRRFRLLKATARRSGGSYEVVGDGARRCGEVKGKKEMEMLMLEEIGDELGDVELCRSQQRRMWWQRRGDIDADLGWI